MSEQIKYEPVFGPQELFDRVNCPSNAVIAINHFRENKEMISYENLIPFSLNLCDGRVSIAMRRIIKTPVWSKADQEAGRLPDVGSKFIACDQVFECAKVYKNTILGINDRTYASFGIDDIHPIETEADRHERLRLEWAKQAAKIANESEQGMCGVFDSLLSGELKMPEVQK